MHFPPVRVSKVLGTAHCVSLLARDRFSSPLEVAQGSAVFCKSKAVPIDGDASSEPGERVSLSCDRKLDLSETRVQPLAAVEGAAPRRRSAAAPKATLRGNAPRRRRRRRSASTPLRGNAPRRRRRRRSAAAPKATQRRHQTLPKATLRGCSGGDAPRRRRSAVSPERDMLAALCAVVIALFALPPFADQSIGLVSRAAFAAPVYAGCGVFSGMPPRPNPPPPDERRRAQLRDAARRRRARMTADEARAAQARNTAAHRAARAAATSVPYSGG